MNYDDFVDWTGVSTLSIWWVLSTPMESSWGLSWTGRSICCVLRDLVQRKDSLAFSPGKAHQEYSFFYWGIVEKFRSKTGRILPWTFDENLVSIRRILPWKTSSNSEEFYHELLMENLISVGRILPGLMTPSHPSDSSSILRGYHDDLWRSTWVKLRRVVFKSCYVYQRSDSIELDEVKAGSELPVLRWSSFCYSVLELMAGSELPVRRWSSFMCLCFPVLEKAGSELPVLRWSSICYSVHELMTGSELPVPLWKSVCPFLPFYYYYFVYRMTAICYSVVLCLIRSDFVLILLDHARFRAISWFCSISTCLSVVLGWLELYSQCLPPFRSPLSWEIYGLGFAGQGENPVLPFSHCFFIRRWYSGRVM